MALLTSCHYPNDDTRLLLWKIEEGTDQLLSYFPEEKRAALRTFLKEKYASESKQKEWLIERILIARHCSPQERLRHRDNGSPFLEFSHENISISHTRGYVAIAFSTCLHFGIDIEHISDRVNRVQDYFMTEDEKSPDHGCDTLYNLVVWSSKESIFKALRDGVANNMKNIHIPPFPLSPKGTFQATVKKHPLLHDSTVYYECHEDFVLTSAFVH